MQQPSPGCASCSPEGFAERMSCSSKKHLQLWGKHRAQANPADPRAELQRNPCVIRERPRSAAHPRAQPCSAEPLKSWGSNTPALLWGSSTACSHSKTAFFMCSLQLEIWRGIFVIVGFFFPPPRVALNCVNSQVKCSIKRSDYPNRKLNCQAIIVHWPPLPGGSLHTEPITSDPNWGRFALPSSS